jgi:protein ImuA
MKVQADKNIIEGLRRQIVSMQGELRQSEGSPRSLGLGEMETAFPGGVFPRAAVHELISHGEPDAAATHGFLATMLGKLMKNGGACLWIGGSQRIYPPALEAFGVEAERILFVRASRHKDVSWVIEESLKCSVLAAVIGEVRELGFNESRRLQLAVEKSGVTGFIHCSDPRRESPVACVSRWKIGMLPGEAPDGLPGLGYPSWSVRLEKVRNGRPGEWQVRWTPEGLKYLHSFTEAEVPFFERETA